LVLHHLRYSQFGAAIGVLNVIIKNRGYDIWALYYRGVAKCMMQAEKLGKLDFIRVQKALRTSSITNVDKISLITFSLALSTNFKNGGQEILDVACANSIQNSVIQKSAFQTRAVLWLQKSNWTMAYADFTALLHMKAFTADEYNLTKHALGIDKGQK
jgi:hypothetical protein